MPDTATLQLGLPTPLLPLDQLGAVAGLPSLLVKRDDLIPFCGGGTKCRKLPALAASEDFRKADPLLVTGSGMSNQVRLIAGLAAWSGRSCEAVLSGVTGASPAEHFVRLLGGEVHRQASASPWELNGVVRSRLRDLRASGRTPYLVPGGSAKDLPGYAETMLELREQLGDRPAPMIILAAGTGATTAGFLLGCDRYLPDAKVLAVSVDLDQAGLRGAVERLLTAASGGDAPAVERMMARLEVDDSEIGAGGYSTQTTAARAAVTSAARHEGLLLESTYSGRAMAALLRRGPLGTWTERTVIFWSTGGTPNLLAALSGFDA